MSYEYFTSSNITGDTRTIVSNPRPDKTYTITISGIDHLKADGLKSGLSDSYSNIINGATSVSFTTPPDNVTSVIDIVRTTGNNVDVYLHEFASSPYPIANYSGNLNYYTNTALTSGSTIVNLTSPSTTPIISNYNLSNLKTQAYYFAAVYRNTQHRYDLTNLDQVFDIRGITYIRNSAFSDPSYDLIVEPAMVNLSHPAFIEYALSADGSVICKTINKTLYIYKNRKLINSYDLSSLPLHDKLIYSIIGDTWILHVAMSGDAKRCVVAGALNDDGTGNSVKIIPINNNLSIGTPTSLQLTGVWNTDLIRKVSMSMDGDTILISGYDSNLREGYAYIYTFSGGSWSSIYKMSSTLIPGYVKEYAYGKTSALSGDGRTAVISGDSSDTASFKDTGYIWKYNEFINNWVFVQKIEFGYNLQHYSLSHTGNTIFVNSTLSKKWAVFEYDNITKQYTRSGLERQIRDNSKYMSVGSISGNGNTIVYMEFEEQDGFLLKNGTVYIHKRNTITGDWTDWTDSPKLLNYNVNTVYFLRGSTIISQDGGMIVLTEALNADSTGLNVVAHINGKVGKAVNTVYDYLESYNVYVPENDITSAIDLVRTGADTIEINVLGIYSQNYPTGTYNIEIYTNDDFTTLASSVSIPITGNTMPLPDLTTFAYYFTEHITFTASDGTSVNFTNQVFDIRGIMYIRDSAFSYTSYDLIAEPAMNDHEMNHEDEIPDTEYALSADGTVILKTSTNKLYIYKNRIFINKYTTPFYEYMYGFMPISMSGDAKRCVVAGASNLDGTGNSVIVIQINNDLSFGTPTSLTLDSSVWSTHLIRKVSMSMDGNTVLISGYNSNMKEGYAHVYTYSGGSWYETSNLSSSIVPGYVQEYKYGQTSALSGDGRTAVIAGDYNPSIVSRSITQPPKYTGYIWKYNEFINEWVNIQKIEFAYDNQHYSLSHLGNIIFVNSTVSKKWAVFEYDNSIKQYNRSGLERDIHDDTRYMSQGSISGDGNVIVYSEYVTYVGVYATVYIHIRNDNGDWPVTPKELNYIQSSVLFIERPKTIISQDGGVIVLANGLNDSTNTVAHINGKVGQAVTTVYDYLVDYNVYVPENDITSAIDLVRTGADTIEINVLGIYSQNYPTDTYNSNIGRYTNDDFTTLASSVSISGSIPITGNTMHVPNLTTVAYYFSEHITFTASDGTSVNFTNQVFDIRGIMYIRDSAFSYTSYDLIAEPAMSHKTDVNFINKFALSADGTVILKTSTNKLYIYKNRIHINNYTTPFYEYTYGFMPVSMSGDAKRCVVAGASNLDGTGNSVIVIQINNDLSLGTTTYLTLDNVWDTYLIRKVSMSMDGNIILISGYNSNNIEGYAHVYTFSGTSWSNPPSDLSSSLVPRYIRKYSYGQTSALSGDGRTALISGNSYDTYIYKDTGYIWKYNEFIDKWVFVQKIEFGYNLQNYSLSHLGNTIFVNSTLSKKWAVFEYDNNTKQYTRSGLERDIHDTDRQMSIGSISGDGNTLVYSEYNKPYRNGNFNVYINKRILGNWTPEGEKMLNYDLPHWLYSSTLYYNDEPSTIISQDGGVIVLANGRNNIINVVAHINGKVGQAVSNVYNYLEIVNVYVPENDILSGIDLVRAGDDTIEINVPVVNSQNYPISTYNISFERYTNKELTGSASSVSISGSIPITGNTMHVPNLTTFAYYFAEHFTFTAGDTSVQFKNKVFDIRGIAYFRDSAFDTYQIINSPEIKYGDRISYYDLTPYAVSEDGSVLISFIKNHLAIYKNRILVNELTDIGMEPTSGSCIAMSSHAKICVIVGNGEPKVYPINNDLTFGTPINLILPTDYGLIYGVSMSMDGNIILISGYNSNNIEGYAHVYTYTDGSWSNIGNLSSSVVPNYNKQYMYGKASAISGDGKTACILGTSLNAGLHTDMGYIWKFNEITKSWGFLHKLSFYANRDIKEISCNLSHMGDILTIYINYRYISLSTWFVFEYNGSEYTNVHEDDCNKLDINYNDRNSNTGSLSGDGSKFAYCSTNNNNQTVYIHKRVSGTWTLNNTIPVNVNFAYSNSPRVNLSFDGGMIILGNNGVGDGSNYMNNFVHINGKVDANVDTVYDYLTHYSSYFGIPDPVWASSGSLVGSYAHGNITANYPSGHWDSMSVSYNGKYMLVGSPSDKKVYLYDIDENTSIEFIKATTNFGCRCAMDDAADYVVISDDTDLYVYETINPSSERITLNRTLPDPHPSGGVPWNLKMSKDGNVIILTEVLGASTIYKWESGGNWATASVDNTSITKPALMVNLFSIDLSYDGSVIVASGKFKIWVRDNGVDHVHDCTDIRTSTSIGDSGQSVAISAHPSDIDGKYVIVAGMPRPYGIDGKAPVDWNKCSIYSVRYKDVTGDGVQFERRNGSNGVQTVTLPTANTARYGRSVSIDALGRWALYSGSHEYSYLSITPTSGGAVLFNLNANNTTATFDYLSSSDNVRYIHVSGLTDQINNDIYSHRGFGVQCKLSSDGSVFAVSGDTEIRSYKSINRNGEINQEERLPDPYFDMYAATNMLLYSTRHSTLSYNGITIAQDLSSYGLVKGDIYIEREGLTTKKYAHLETGHSFGIFSVGLSNFTIAFVLRSYVEGTGDSGNQGRLTYGLDPDDKFNIHFSSNDISFYPIFFNDVDIQAVKGNFVTLTSNYTLMFASYNKDVDNGKLTFLLRNESNKFVKEFVNVNNGIFYTSHTNPDNPRLFTITSNSSIPQHIYEMLIFHEYIGIERNNYPIFGKIEDMVDVRYGITK